MRSLAFVVERQRITESAKSILCGTNDAAKYAARPLKDVFVPEAKHLETRRIAPCIARTILKRPREVDGAIGFDDKARFGAEEVDDERSKRLLPSKLQPRETTTAQKVPECTFRLGRSGTQLTCSVGLGSYKAGHAPLSSTGRLRLRRENVSPSRAPPPPPFGTGGRVRALTPCVRTSWPHRPARCSDRREFEATPKLSRGPTTTPEMFGIQMFSGGRC